MNYQKPQLVPQGTAITAIKGGMVKGASAIELPDHQSNEAYVSDES
ncbi:MAG TPA: hypothetical protein VI685_06005 [Candidatus Angelobacter sp.]